MQARVAYAKFMSKKIEQDIIEEEEGKGLKFAKKTSEIPLSSPSKLNIVHLLNDFLF